MFTHKKGKINITDIISIVWNIMKMNIICFTLVDNPIITPVFYLNVIILNFVGLLLSYT